MTTICRSKQKQALDKRIGEILEDGRKRAASILHEQRGLVETLRDLLLEKKVVDAKIIASLTKRN